jgi:hypothetical protein
MIPIEKGCEIIDHLDDNHSEFISYKILLVEYDQNIQNVQCDNFYSFAKYNARKYYSIFKDKLVEMEIKEKMKIGSDKALDIAKKAGSYVVTRGTPIAIEIGQKTKQGIITLRDRTIDVDTIKTAI